MFLFNYKFTFYKLLGLFFFVYLIIKYCKKKIEHFKSNRGNKYKLDITEYDNQTNYGLINSKDFTYLFWNGSFTSTFRLCQLLLLEEKPVQTIYINCCNSNINPYRNNLELNTIKYIRQLIYKKYPYIKNRLPPTIYVNSIQKDNKLSNKFDSLYQNNNIFESDSKKDIYENLARFSFHYNQPIELPIEKDNYHLQNIFPYFKEVNKQKKLQIIDSNLIKNNKNNNNLEELSILKNCVFSCTNLNKQDIKNIALQYYFYYLLQNTTFCRNPNENLDICKQCSGCEKSIIMN